MLIRNLFIPRKGQPAFSAQDDNTKMLAIENWAKTVVANALTGALGGHGFTVGGPAPAGTAPSVQSDSISGSATAGTLAITFDTPFQYGYVAFVCSGDDTGALIVAVVPTASSLTELTVNCYTLSGTVTGAVVVNYWAVGA